MHPILDSLVGTEREVIRNLLFAFNSGDIPKFQALVPEMAEKEVRPPPSVLSSCLLEASS